MIICSPPPAPRLSFQALSRRNSTDVLLFRPSPCCVAVMEYGRYGAQSLEEKQKLFKLVKSIGSGAESASESSTPPVFSFSASQSGMDGYFPPELRGDFNAGILDLHSIDDTEFFPEIAMAEPFQSSPSFVPVVEKGFEPDISSNSFKGRMQGLSQSSPLRSSSNERDKTGNNSNLARIRVVVRKRPLNKKELSRKEEDIITINDVESSLTVNEPKVKVDLTAYIERHEFVFDAVLNQHVSNDEVYRSTVEPIVPTIFNRTKATCFAYGQTGSGKTYTMQPLPLRACQDIMSIMQQPSHRNQGLQLWLSFFEIYGGKLYDLLNERRKLCMREDGRQQVCIVGLKEFRVSDVELVKEYIDKGNASRSTGSTGANEESSRSHAILQLVVKKAQEGKEVSRVVGKISFIDLAGSERGADTTDNDRQTRMEGAEINKSLLALKECIRALDNDQGHIPFRGSKLTEVLRDSFVGDSRTVMISCISPNAGSCEHTLNTLRYADRVKGLSKNSNSKRDPNSSTSVPRESASSPPPLSSAAPVALQLFEFGQDSRLVENGRRPPLDPGRYLQQGERELCDQSIEYSYSGRELSRVNSIGNDRDGQRLTDTSELSAIDEPQEVDRTQGIFSARRKIGREAKFDRPSIRDELHKSDGVFKRQTENNRDELLKPDGSSRHQYDGNREEASKPDGNSRRQLDQIPNTLTLAKAEPEVIPAQYNREGHINAILEEEEEVISAHRKEVEDTMEIVREEMKLLAEVDQPGSRIDRYVSQLNYVLSRKAAGIVNLQARLARFQRHMKEQEILSRTSGLRQM
nr:kinesin-like protein KIN-13B isoform X2 [Physcomitrium patens]|eukprot:XP_024396063.1 kinesin-like protein KIN-13B isoform X2 [Physcomitrella patens]